MSLPQNTRFKFKSSDFAVVPAPAPLKLLEQPAEAGKPSHDGLRNTNRRVTVELGVYATLIAALLFGSVFAVSWRTDQNTGLDHEYCWSCGQRNQHKLWCPNR
jgi:hypothetical protein